MQYSKILSIECLAIFQDNKFHYRNHFEYQGIIKKIYAGRYYRNWMVETY